MKKRGENKGGDTPLQPAKMKVPSSYMTFSDMERAAVFSVVFDWSIIVIVSSNLSY